VTRTPICLLAAALVIGGCSTPFTQTRDPISAGSAKLLLEVGTTSQSQVLESFGGPNIVTGDAAGRETWTYDRMSYESSSSGIGGAAGGAGAGGSGGGGGLIFGQASRASTSSRTVTLFLYWEGGVLVDFKYRSATF
jgi:hypothetical protein